MDVNTGNVHQEILFKCRQVFICLGPVIITISLGMAEGYSAILLPQLESDYTWDINTELSSWIASIATLPMSLGCVLGGWLMEVIGRKSLHLATCIPNLIGWIMIGLTGHSVELLLTGRFLTGMCVGVLGPVLQVYVAETSDPKFRGFLLPTVSLALNFGIALAHLLGTFFHWAFVALLACVFPVVCFVLMLFVPESPTFLIKSGEVDRAVKGFLWFRGDSIESRGELEVLKAKQQEEASLPKKTLMEYLKIFLLPEFYRPLVVLGVFFTTMQLSGSNPIAFYTINILREVLKDSFDPYTSMLIMDAVRVVSAVLGCFGLRYMKRRALMLISCSGSIVSLLILSLYSWFDINQPGIAVAALVGYILFSNAGLLPLPYSMSGELFAQSCRGLGSGLVVLYNMALMFVLVKITPWLFDAFKAWGAFAFFGVCCAMGMVVLIRILPETKDKPLHEIEDYFKSF